MLDSIAEVSCNFLHAEKHLL